MLPIYLCSTTKIGLQRQCFDQSGCRLTSRNAAHAQVGLLGAFDGRQPFDGRMLKKQYVDAPRLGINACLAHYKRSVAMSAYVIAQIEIKDGGEYQKYLAGFMPIFERHGGELLATSKNKTTVIEGEWAYPGTVIMKFPSPDHAREWYSDPDYKELAEHRHRSAMANLVIVEGIS